ncbi:MAG: hypothetical protein JWL72_1230, partial [Ilumatobacteraceae bacterium]|nr:hypothetical protein [Ilumatobacteraceae bacterium]
RELIVATDVQSAFGWFTAHIGAWWPVAELSVLGAESSVGFEGDLLVERQGAARSVWAEVIRWDPPGAVELAWHPGRTDGVVTDVRITFESAGGGTRVTIEHSGWERTAAPEAVREEYGHGWPMVLDRLAVRIDPSHVAPADASVDARANDAPGRNWYVLTHRPANPGLVGSVFADPRFGEHVAFIQRLAAAGDLIAAGPLPDQPGAGMTVLSTTLRADDVHRMATAEDGSVTGGLFAVQITPWDVRFAP